MLFCSYVFENKEKHTVWIKYVKFPVKKWRKILYDLIIIIIKGTWNNASPQRVFKKSFI